MNTIAAAGEVCFGCHSKGDQAQSAVEPKCRDACTTPKDNLTQEGC